MNMAAVQANVGNNPSGGHPAAAPVPIHPERTDGAAAAQAHPAPATKRNKRGLRRVLMLGGILVVLVGTSVAYLNGGRYVGTDDAYVKAAQLTVTTDVSGVVKFVDVHEG